MLARVDVVFRKKNSLFCWSFAPNHIKETFSGKSFFEIFKKLYCAVSDEFFRDF